nr:hypothetical protein [uncultured Cohaesibacter sp.]
MTTNKNKKGQSDHDVMLRDAFKDKTRPVLELDVAYFQTYLDDTDTPESQKQEFLAVLWNIMVTFVDMGFGIEATQQAMQSIPAIDAALREGDAMGALELTGVFEGETSNHPKMEESEEEANYEIR